MKVIKNKCPKCGNNTIYNNGDKELICSNCNLHIPISSKQMVVKKFVSSKVYKDDVLCSSVYYNPLSKIYITIVIGIVLYCLTLTLFTPGVVSIIKKIDNKKYDKMVDFSELDSQSIAYIVDESFTAIRFDEDAGPDEIFHYGFYFLHSKGDDSSKVYDICRKIVYAQNSVIVSYVPVLYTDLKVKKDGYYQYGKKEYDPPQKNITTIDGVSVTYYGYDSLEDLYDKVIKPQEGDYNIEATEGLFIES